MYKIQKFERKNTKLVKLLAKNIQTIWTQNSPCLECWATATFELSTWRANPKVATDSSGGLEEERQLIDLVGNPVFP